MLTNETLDGMIAGLRLREDIALRRELRVLGFDLTSSAGAAEVKARVQLREEPSLMEPGRRRIEIFVDGKLCGAVLGSAYRTFKDGAALIDEEVRKLEYPESVEGDLP
jgi:hypothetical protein